MACGPEKLLLNSRGCPPRKVHTSFRKGTILQKDFEKYPTHPAATPVDLSSCESSWRMGQKGLRSTPNFIQPWSSGHFGSGVFVKTRSLRELIYNPDGYFHHVYSQVAGAYPPSSHGHFLSLWQVDRQYLSVEAPCARTKKGAGAQGTREGWRVGVVPVGVGVKNMGQWIFFTGVGFRVYGIFYWILVGLFDFWVWGKWHSESFSEPFRCW